MQKELLEKLKAITDEERVILAGGEGVQKALYTENESFVVDSKKMLERGRLIAMRSNTRFVHFPKHGHNYIEVMYMCAGACTHVISGERVVLREGELLLLGNRTTHEILPCAEEDIAVNFIILPEFFDRPFSMMEEKNVLHDFLVSAISGGGNAGDYLHFKTEGHLPSQNLIENMIWSIVNRNADSASILQTTMGLLFMNLSHLTESLTQGGTHVGERRTVLDILTYIETHYKDGTLGEVAAAVHRPVYTVSRMLKRHTGSNFKELLGKRKMQQASFLLLQTTLPIERIMEAVGYNNSSYFYRTFKDTFGVSPKEYRDEHK